MIFSNTSNYMLKYQKAKAKLVEYDIPQKDYPKFPLNSNELSYPVVYILSRYAESVIENNVADMEIFNDRFLANLLADEIGHDSIEANSIVGVIKSHKDDILDILSAYPTYFSERVQWICKD